MKVYLDVATALLSQDPPPRLESPVVARIVTAVTAQRFTDGAQALGWYSYNTQQIRTARDWFRTALSWKPEDEPSAYGLALSTQRLNERAAFAAVVAQWRGRSQRIAELAGRDNPALRQQAGSRPRLGLTCRPGMSPHPSQRSTPLPVRSPWSVSKSISPWSGPRRG